MPPTIFFSATSKHNAAHAECIRHIFNEIIAPTLTNQVEPIQCITDDPVQILQQLKKQQNSIALFHFGGRDHEFQALLNAGPQVGIDSLPEYLANLPQLDLVFLSYCSRKRFVDRLRSAGIEVVVGTSRHIAQRQATQFASVFYRQFLIDGRTTNEAFEEATRSIGISRGNSSRQYAGIHGNKKRRWREEKEKLTAEPLIPHISEGKSSIPIPETIPLPPTPFPGEQPFQRQDAHVFLGRQNELILFCRHLAKPDVQPITLLYGPNGVGKSSFLNAGLLPRVEDRFEIYHLSSQEKPKLFEAMCQIIDTPARIPTEAFWASWLHQQSKSVLLVIDQFEPQLLSQNSKMQLDLAQLISAIRILLSSSTSCKWFRVIFSIRKANLAQLQNLLMKQNLLSQTHYFPLKPLNEDGIRNALYGFRPDSPLATHYGFSIEETVIERIVTDLTQDPHSPIAPFLQAIFVKLWKESATTSPQRLSLRRYQQLYCEGSLLRDFLNSRLALVRQKRPSIIRYKELIELLATYTALAETSKKRPIKAQETTQRTITHLKNFYLLTEKAGGPTNKLYLGHKLLEAPITQQFYRFMKDYTWFERQRFELGFIIDQLKARPVQPPPAKQKNQQSTSRLLGWFNQKTELTRGLVTLFTLLILLTLLTSFTLLFLFTFRQLLQPTLQQAVASPSGSQPYTLTVPPTFIAPSAEPMINVASGQRSFSVELKRVSTLYGYGTLPLTYTNQRGSILAFSPDSTLLFAGGGDNTVEVWRVMGLQAQPSLLVPAPSIVLTSVTRQGGLLIYTTLDGSVGRLYLDDSGGLMPTQPNEPVELLRHKGPVTAIQLNNDAALLVTGGQDGVLYHYDMETGQLVTLRSEPTDPISAVAIHPNKQMIASAGTNQLIVLWDRTTATIADQLAGHSGRVNSLEFSQDGARLLAASSDGSVCIWQLATGTRDYCFVDRTIGVNVAHYSTDGTLIMLAKNDGFIEVWDAVSHRRLDKVEAHPVGVSDLAISADGRHLASAGWDSSIALWEISVSAVPPQ